MGLVTIKAFSIFKDYGVRCAAIALFMTLIMPLRRAEVVPAGCY
ncbi:MAG: hypothetical protein ACI9WS_002674 [Paraglaciecola psychrophila]|jgi:hypothetical protein